MISGLLPLEMLPFNKKNPPSSSSSSPERKEEQAREDRRVGLTNPRHNSNRSAVRMLGGPVPAPPNREEQSRQLDLVTSQAHALASELQQLQQLQLLQQQQRQQQQQTLQQQAYLRDALTRPAPLAFGSFPGRIDFASAAAAAASSTRTTTDPAAVAAAVSNLLRDAAHANRNNLVQQQQERLLWERQAALDSYLRAQQQHPQPLMQQLLQLQQLQQLQQQQPFPSSLRIQAGPSTAAAAAASLAAAASSPTLAVSAPGVHDGKVGTALKGPPPARARKESMNAASVSGEGSAATSSEGQRFPSERQALDEVSGRCPSPKTATKVLKTIGTTLRSKADPFVDVASFPLQDVNMNEKRRGASVFFPEILHRLLAEAERDGWSTSIVGWLPHDRAFRVHNKPRFEKEILPRYFVGQTKWSSFSRQLNLYGWLRVTSGPDYGAYYHELFIRHRPDLHSFMRRVGKPHLMDRRKHKLAEGDDPNFYGMPTVPEVPAEMPPPTESTATTTTSTAAEASTSSRQASSAPPLKSSEPESASTASSESQSAKAETFGKDKKEKDEQHREPS